MWHRTPLSAQWVRCAVGCHVEQELCGSPSSLQCWGLDWFQTFPGKRTARRAQLFLQSPMIFLRHGLCRHPLTKKPLGLWAAEPWVGVASAQDLVHPSRALPRLAWIARQADRAEGLQIFVSERSHRDANLCDFNSCGQAAERRLPLAVHR